MPSIRRFGMLLAALLALAPALARACGLPLEARISYEQALLIVEGRRQQLIATVDLRDAAPDAGVVFPVPGLPEAVDQPAGGGELFPYLKQATRPLVRRERRFVWAPAPDRVGAPAGGVAVLGEQTLGGYTVARLAANDPGALQAWLTEHGYGLPPAAEPILAAYVAEGWGFVAVKLAASAPNGSLDPLRISYESDQLVYPMRLGALADQPIAVDLFVLAPYRVAAPPLATAYAGPVAQLDLVPPAGLAPLLGAAPYLTHVRGEALNPAAISGDLILSQAPSDEPYREEIIVYDEVAILGEGRGLFVALVCLTMITPLSLLIALAIRRRILRLSPPRE